MANETAKLQNNFTESSPEDRLSSWKEIAAYLKCSERTVRRWEEEGLPVHRHPHKAKAAIYAYKAEIDVWWRDGHGRAKQIQDLQEQPPAVAAQWWTRPRLIVPVFLAIVALGMGGYFYLHRTPKLTDKDTIVLADFANTTGDAVFDDTLKTALTVSLRQSPFLNVLSDSEVAKTLQQMTLPVGSRLTPTIARELCQRTGSAAVLDGSIAQIGTPYLLTVEAVNCSNGATLASTEARASDKNHVLDALGKSASEMRNKLGESLSTVQKFDTPLEEATTPSLEALKAYSLGWKAFEEASDFAAAIPFFQRAIQLDPNFAMAYALLSTSYSNLGETKLGAENIRKAHELLKGVSEREKFFIEICFYVSGTGDLDEARRSAELWAQTYPRDVEPAATLGFLYSNLGQHNKALAANRDALRLDTGSGLSYANLVASYLNLNRLEEALATAEEAQVKKLDSPPLRVWLYMLAFLKNDAEGMAQQVAWATEKPGREDALLFLEAETSAYSGRLAKAQGLSRRAVDSAVLAKEKETAAAYAAHAALREALFGNSTAASKRAATLGHSKGRDVQFIAALALALAEDTAQVQALTNDLAKHFPEDTIVQFNYLTTLRAQLALSHHDSSMAIEALRTATPYELGAPGFSGFSLALYPVYVRGEAYLAAHRGREAEAEFQKILDHRGLVINEPIGVLAHLQLGRAYVLQGDTAKAKTAYLDFLTLWKNADPDIPILKQAKAEYGKLQ